MADKLAKERFCSKKISIKKLPSLATKPITCCPLIRDLDKQLEHNLVVWSGYTRLAIL